MASRWADSHLVAGSWASTWCHAPRLGQPPGLFSFPRPVDATSFSDISQGNRLPRFQPAASSHQHKLCFNILALCCWHLIDAAVWAACGTRSCCLGGRGGWAIWGLHAKTSSRFWWDTCKDSPHAGNSVSCPWCLLPLHTSTGLELSALATKSRSLLKPRGIPIQQPQHGSLKLFFTQLCFPRNIQTPVLLTANQCRHFVQLNTSSAAGSWVSAAAVGLANVCNLYSYDPLGWNSYKNITLQWPCVLAYLSVHS